MGVPENIAAREAGKTLADMVVEEAANHDQASNSFWIPIAAVVPVKYKETHRDANLPLVPMTEKQATSFERTTFPFGSHVGKPIAKVPLKYLFWLESQRKFLFQLQRYLLSDRVQREQETP